ncbi:axon guidance protein [Schistosoma mansoni]|uniref:axon guidance protein n=1 Tax=Schistosoma mansoni TaxID=6183 RepID=UPI00022DC6DE|nr:axon guidance protein [Schistosoma mansoni]|eukprot:XP_018651488.1 axon guidance protein [Schistosoma mansoni]
MPPSEKQPDMAAWIVNFRFEITSIHSFLSTALKYIRRYDFTVLMIHALFSDLKENPLQCDCHIQPFLNEFIMTNRLAILQKSGAVCSSLSTDPSLHGYPLSENVYQTLQCPHNNRISYIHPQAFNNLHELSSLYLVHNPLICDCQLAAWLPVFLIEKEAGGTQWVRCAEPLNVQGHHVRELLPHILDCPSNINYKEENHSCEFHDYQCPDGCRCKDIIIKPRMHANSEAIFRQDEFGSILGGLSVDCSSLELTEIPDNLPINTKELILRNNLIKSITIESGLSKLKSLETLILSNNSLTYLEEKTFNGLKNIEILLLQHNQIKCLNNRTFHQTPVLKILMLNNNKLRCIAKGIFTELNLESLSLSANPFKCDCHLSWLPDWLRNNANQINEGPSPPICISPEDLAGTPVASLSRYHFICKNSVSNCLSTNENLHLNEKLNTNENGIVQSVQNVYCDTTGTSCCEEIADRNLTEIPVNISPETTQLYLERNQITKIDSNRIAHLKKLQTLVLSYNKLRELPPRVFEKLSNLKTIVLSYNNLQCIHPEAFHGLSNLRVLILQGNNISSIPQGTFNDLGQLNNLALGQNPLHCDCTTKWLNGFFRQNFLDNGISLCHSPSNMRLKSIYHSKPTDFICPLKQHDLHNEINTSSLVSRNENLLYFQNAKISDQHNHQDQISNSKSIQEVLNREKESLIIAAKCMPCLLNPCQNGGTCLALTQLDYKCSCKPPYYGKNCEQRDHICSTNPCQNGGLCKITAYPSSYKCICPTGFHGPTCTKQMETCRQNLCENGGTCEVVDNDYRCHCTALFHGKNCQHEYIYCEELNPCGNGGKCISLPKNNYRCECLTGWIGNDCQINQDDCIYNRCENGATCVDGINEYICKCRPGYAGIYCERPTWKQSTYITRMDRPFNYQLMIGRTSVPGVRQSPIKTRSLTTQNLDTLCAYQQCQNNAKCVENQNDAYTCICQKDGIPEHYLLVDLHDGQIHVKFSLNRNYTTHNMNCNININDGNFHQIKLYLEAKILFLYIDNNLCITMGKVNTKLNESISNHGHNNPIHSSSIFTYNMVIKSKHLALTSPLYFGGVPVDQLETARHLTNGLSELGLTGCIRNVQINGRMIDFARLFGAPVDKMIVAEEHDIDSSSPEAKHHGTAIGILPGCRLSNEKSEYMESAVEFQANNNESQKLKSINLNTNQELETRKSESLKIGQLHNTKTSDKATLCDPHGNNSCLNGGICENNEMNQTIKYQCKCPTGFKGERCEIVPVCHRETQRSYIRDPQTNCISSRKLSIRKCSGSCDSTMINLQQQESFNNDNNDITNDNESFKYHKWKAFHKRSTNSDHVWLPQNLDHKQSHIIKMKDSNTPISSPYSIHLNSYKITSSMTKQHCCQAIKIKLRPILFNCPNGAVYERTIKLAKKCTCIQCD